LCLPLCARDGIQENFCKRSLLLILLLPRPLCIAIQAETSGDERTKLLLAIENVKINNYLTEKLIDCLITRTIPIYWGCPNIAKYFDQGGIYLVNNEQEIVDICNTLTPEDYYERITSIEYNYTECLKYIYNISIRLQKIINEFFLLIKRVL